VDAIGGNVLYDLLMVFPATLLFTSILLERYGLVDSERPWWMRLYIRWHDRVLAKQKRRYTPTPVVALWGFLAFFGGLPLLIVFLIPVWGFRSSVPGQPVFSIWLVQIAALCLQVAIVGPGWFRIYTRRRAKQ
jgi:hypothetical protein